MEFCRDLQHFQQEVPALPVHMRRAVEKLFFSISATKNKSKQTYHKLRGNLQMLDTRTLSVHSFGLPQQQESWIAFEHHVHRQEQIAPFAFQNFSNSCYSMKAKQSDWAPSYPTQVPAKRNQGLYKYLRHGRPVLSRLNLLPTRS